MLVSRLIFLIVFIRCVLIKHLMACCGNKNLPAAACCTNRLDGGEFNCCKLEGEGSKRNAEYKMLSQGPSRHVVRVPVHSRQHPMIPQLYVMEWRNDMQNRNHIINNAELGGVPHFEHDDNLFWEKKEQLSYNVEEKARVATKVCVPHRGVLLNPPRHHPTSKMQSSLMYYKPC